MSTTTTEYGTWYGAAGAASVGGSVAEYLSGGGVEWLEQLTESGAYERIVDAYRAAINAALPDGVTLNGNRFYGPYPCPDNARQIIIGAVDSVDLAAIVAEHGEDADLDEMAMGCVEAIRGAARLMRTRPLTLPPGHVDTFARWLDDYARQWEQTGEAPA